MVDGNGRISLPLVGPVQASGATAIELAQRVGAILRQSHVRNPQVSVNLAEMVSQFVTIDGEVQAPGTYPVVGRQTLMGTLARARGATEFARLTHVVVIERSAGAARGAL